VGVTGPRRYPILARPFAAVNPEFVGKTGKNPVLGALVNVGRPLTSKRHCDVCRQQAASSARPRRAKK